MTSFSGVNNHSIPTSIATTIAYQTRGAVNREYLSTTCASLTVYVATPLFAPPGKVNEMKPELLIALKLMRSPSLQMLVPFRSRCSMEISNKNSKSYAKLRMRCPPVPETSSPVTNAPRTRVRGEAKKRHLVLLMFSRFRTLKISVLLTYPVPCKHLQTLDLQFRRPSHIGFGPC